MLTVMGIAAWNLVADRLHTFSITLEESGIFHLREKASLGDVVNHNKGPRTEYPVLARDPCPGVCYMLIR